MSVQPFKKKSSGIRPRPSNVFGAYRICPQIRHGRECHVGDLCSFAHSEAERNAWEADRRKGNKREKTNKQNKKHNMELNDISARNEMDFFHIFRLLYLNKNYKERTIIAQ